MRKTRSLSGLTTLTFRLGLGLDGSRVVGHNAFGIVCEVLLGLRRRAKTRGVRGAGKGLRGAVSSVEFGHLEERRESRGIEQSRTYNIGGVNVGMKSVWGKLLIALRILEEW